MKGVSVLLVFLLLLMASCQNKEAMATPYATGQEIPPMTMCETDSIDNRK
ncbi:MAG: hypothetical protein WBA74_00260 [Cyclobacteriaceae bacterium]